MESFECRGCGVPVTVPELVSTFRFPDDVDLVVDLLAGRLNVVRCTVCKTETPVVGLLVAMNTPERLVAAVVPDEKQADAVVQSIAEELPEDYQVSAVVDYGELYGVVTQWLWRHTQPVFEGVSTGAILEKQDDEWIDFVSPMFLAALALSAEGMLPIAMTANRELTEQDRQRHTKQMLRAFVSEQLSRTLRVLGRRGELAEAYDEVVRRIPMPCFTAEVLELTAANCAEVVNPYDSPPQFVAGFRAHLKNAIAHARAGTPSPWGRTWAAYVALVWRMRDRPDTELDPQLLLSAHVLRPTLAFEDLWNMVIPAVLQMDDDLEQELERATELITHCGFEAELIEAMRFPLVASLPRSDGTDDTARQLVEMIEQRLPELRADDPGAEMTPLPSLLLMQLLQSGAGQEVMALIERMLSRAQEQDDAASTLSIAANAIEALNWFERYDDAQDILELVLSDARSPGVPLGVLTSFWNEAGNVMRYRRSNDFALRAYGMSARANELSNHPEREERSRVLRRNTAIVLRQKGDFSGALRELEAMKAETPDDVHVLDSLATVYAEVNLFGDAVATLDAALSLPGGMLDRVTRLHLLRNRGWAHHLAGDDDAAVADLALGWADLATDAPVMRARFAAAAMQLRPTGEEAKTFVDECRQHLATVLDGDDEIDIAAAATTLTALGTRLLEDGMVQAAGILATRHQALVDELGERRPWQLDLFLGWQRFESGDRQRCWPFLSEALRTVDAQVPSGANAAFSLTWMQDKVLLQRIATRISLALVDSGELAAEELVGVFELLNGREMAARLDGVDDMQADRSPASMLVRHAAATARRGRPVETFFFIDGPDTVRLAHVPFAASDVHLEDLVLDTEQVLAVRAATRQALAAANPASLGVLDHKLGPWRNLSAALWAAIEGCVRPGCHVVFLPGRAFTGLPLHLVGSAEGPTLLESMSVSYAPNFATLDNQAGPAPSDGSRPIVVVTKRTDTEQFRLRAEAAARSLGDVMNETLIMEGTSADRTAVTSAMTEAAEMVFLCHGADAGLDRGHGICLADGGRLPPSLLPIEHAPELGRFVLTWDDLVDVRPTPALVLSTACSTAQTRVLEGGARLGLEQTLFASGTEHIVSPLWDVEQGAALEWLQLFYRRRNAQPSEPVEDTYRAASLDLRASFPHLFHWAPFIVNGRISNGG